MPVTRGFQIEEILSQDDRGVVFEALETATGRRVLLTRFFPAGTAGGGFPEAARRRFEECVAVLRDVAHPGLRGVVGGGCDPADGIPYIAAEWLDGRTLAHVLGGNVLAADDARGVLARALEVSGLISDALGADDLWVGTDLAALVVAGGGRGVVFPVAERKCAGVAGGSERLEPLAALAEDLLGWRGRLVGAQAGGGLGGWIKWLRAHPEASIRQAREALAATGGQEAPAAGPGLGTAAGRHEPPLGARPARSGARAWLAAAAAVAVVAAGGWYGMKMAARRQAEAANRLAAAERLVAEAPLPARSPRDPPAVRPSVERNGIARRSPALPLAGEPAPLPPRAKPDLPAPDGVFDPRQRPQILERFHKEVTIEGVLARVRLSANRRIWYLEFSTANPPDQARAFLYVNDGARTITPADLEPLVGKRIRLRGRVDSEHINKVRQPKLILHGWDAVRLFE